MKYATNYGAPMPHGQLPKNSKHRLSRERLEAGNEDRRADGLTTSFYLFDDIVLHVVSYCKYVSTIGYILRIFITTAIPTLSFIPRK